MATEVVANKKKKWNDEAKWGLAFALLPVVSFLLFTAGPFLFSIFASFTDWSSMWGFSEFVGLENYKEILVGDESFYFWRSLLNTFFYMIGIPIGLFWALFLALAFNRKMPGVKVFRVIYYIPVVSSIVAVSILWKWFYNGDYGLLNQLLKSIFGVKGPNWLTNEHTVKPAITAMAVWKGVGFSALLYLGALQNLPKSYYEAAYVDGASQFTIFRKITWPLLKPITFYIVVTGIIGGAQMIVEPQVMTVNGGTNYSAATIVFYIWQRAFGSGDLKGLACAASWILAIVIFVVTAIQFKFGPSNDNYLE